MKRLSSRRRAQCGAAAIELGLLFLPMAAITFGTTELGDTARADDEEANIRVWKDLAGLQEDVVSTNSVSP